MRLRVILVVLSLLALLTSSIGGYLYYSSLKASALRSIHRQAGAQAEAVENRFNAFIREQLKTVRVLANLDEISDALNKGGTEALARANIILDLFTEALRVDVCYVMNPSGETIASSNRNAADSFVGQNFAFRPYFKEALKGQPSIYMALGARSGIRGLYYSHPVFGEATGQPVGIAVIKASIDFMERELKAGENEIMLLADPHGIIFLSSRADWRYKSLRPLSEDEMEEIARSVQFGTGPWKWSGLTFPEDRRALDSGGREYLMYRIPVDDFPGWQIIYLRNLKTVLAGMLEPLTRTHRTVILALCLLVGLAVLVLYRQASSDIVRRRRAEAALRESEERYRLLYLNTPAILHSIDPEGRLLSVSDYWAEALGHSREEVIGRKVTDFMTPESQKYAEETVIPEFLKTGFCRDISYQYVKKDGEIIDALLSAIAERDEEGRIVRSLSVLVDVTQLKKAQKDLQDAKEELSRYSHELESKVRERTQEITSILRHTPAVVYMKDREGRYLLVNSRFEELFGFMNEHVLGKTDAELFPGPTAESLSDNDRMVLESQRPHQIEEELSHGDGVHTYLSVKFPLFDESGRVYAVCGISTDITLIKKAQDQLRRLSASIMEGQEKERAAVARELHDQLGQVLTALRIDTMWMASRLEGLDDPKPMKRALAMCRLIDGTIDEVRRMAVRLRPGVLDDLGLMDALEWYVADFEERTDVACTLKHDNVPRVDGMLATAAYRICQEALTNVARHSMAGHVDVSLGINGKKLMIEIRDDGCGFDTSLLAESKGLGVAGMRERAGLMGGALEIRSEPEKGTRVVCWLPIESPAEVVL